MILTHATETFNNISGSIEKPKMNIFNGGGCTSELTKNIQITPNIFSEKYIANNNNRKFMYQLYYLLSALSFILLNISSVTSFAKELKPLLLISCAVVALASLTTAIVFHVKYVNQKEIKKMVNKFLIEHVNGKDDSQIELVRSLLEMYINKICTGFSEEYKEIDLIFANKDAFANFVSLLTTATIEKYNSQSENNPFPFTADQVKSSSFFKYIQIEDSMKITNELANISNNLSYTKLSMGVFTTFIVIFTIKKTKFVIKKIKELLKSILN